MTPIQVHRVFCFVLFCFVLFRLCFGVPAWRIIQVYSIAVGFSPTVILLTLCYCRQWETRLNALKRFCSCSLCSHLNVLTIFLLSGGCSEGLNTFRSFFEHHPKGVKIKRQHRVPSGCVDVTDTLNNAVNHCCTNVERTERELVQPRSRPGGLVFHAGVFSRRPLPIPPSLFSGKCPPPFAYFNTTGSCFASSGHSARYQTIG